MRKFWAFSAVVAMAASLSSCGGDSASGGGDYTQVGDVSIDTALGDGVTGTDGTASDTITLTDGTDSSDAIGPDASGTDATALDTPPAKYPDCLSLIGCVAQSCSPASWANGCDAVCLTGAGADAAIGYATVSSCIQNTCRDGLCKGSTDPKCIGDCIGQKCMNKIAVCGANGKTGTAPCGSYLTCAQGCATAKDPLGCITACYASLSPTAQSEYAALDACASVAGTTDAFASCPEQALTCLAAGASGTKSCIEALSCSSVCNTGTDAQKGACMTACWAQTTPAGQTAFAGAIKCQGAADKAGCTDAMLSCTDPSGTATCTATITCSQGCQQTDPQAKTTCIYGCIHAASKTEAKKLLDLQVCMGTCNCKGDKTCENTCVTGPCKAQLATCQAP